MLALEIFLWIIFFYGLLSLIRDIYDEFIYKKINKNIKIYITMENTTKNLELILREICEIKRKNKFREITIVNLDKNIHKNIEKEIAEKEFNFKILKPRRYLIF